MNHETLMQHAVTLAAAFIQNGDLRHDDNYKDDGSSITHDFASLLVIQMYRAVEEASFEALQTSWAERSRRGEPETGGNA